MGSFTQPIKSFSIEELHALFGEVGLPGFRAMQVLEWVYVKQVGSFGEMTNLPKSLREQLESSFPLYSLSIVDKQVSRDGTRKYLLETPDGALVETVGIPSDSGRLTVCASSQSGCAMGCVFCATGKSGLTRNLMPGEIVDQVGVVQNDFGMRVTNVVLMGQGEPFANYNSTMGALRILNHPKLLGIGARHMTVSTCGLIRGIEAFSQEPEQFTLAVSLHSAVQRTRDSIMPAMANQRLDTLSNALAKYGKATGRRFSFEYALMEGVNDSEGDLGALVDYCRGLLCHVNLIPLNDVAGSSARPVSRRVLQHWNDGLERAGIASSIRDSRGDDIAAACGQLAGSYREIARRLD